MIQNHIFKPMFLIIGIVLFESIPVNFRIKYYGIKIVIKNIRKKIIRGIV